MTNGEKVLNKLIELHGGNPVIAFMPYKHCMFDCMEPLYMAAVEKGIEARLAPLDYQTLNDNAWHNERDLFKQPTEEPDIIHHMHFDYIVIHYPYDATNNVTRVRTEHCSFTLRNYGKLVYIPYHGNIAGEEWTRFFRTPGAVNSDVIVLGSNNDVRWFKGQNPHYQGTIIQTEGSLKAECARLHANDPLPEEYTNLGGYVTLISGTLWTFTHDAEGRMAKHLAMIRSELTLGHTVIYRPHPLVYEAIAVMRPRSLAAYNEFLEQVADVAILDQSPYLHHAIRVADKLICDPSSVVKTWQGTGKPYEVIE